MDEERSPHRIRFPEEEAGLPWLPMLLDAYAIIDRGVMEAVRAEEERRGTKLACAKGCANCCRAHTDIPVYPLELVGIYWFASEKLAGRGRKTLKRQLMKHRGGTPCPFLVGDACIIHPLRPVACRQFNVFGAPCGQGEDPFFTRREDVLIPLEEYTNRAFSVMLPFYGVTGEAQKAHVIKNKLIHTQAENLQGLEWKNLIKAVEGKGAE